MEDLRLSVDGDLALGPTGDLEVVTGEEAITQRLRFTLQHFRGEWFLDESFGVPWFQSVLRKNPEGVVVEAVLKQAILSVDGVVALTRFEATWDRPRRALSVRFQVRTGTGTLDLSEVFA